MSSAPTIDLEQLLSPIEGENPCGENLRWDPVYDQIREAGRDEDKDALVESDEPTVQWPLVIELTTQTLVERSKDLQLAGYLTQALTEKQGFAGLRDGIRLVNGLLDNFWENVFPEIDEGDMEPRVAPLVWLTEPDRGARVPNRIRDVPVFPRQPDAPALSYNFWKARYVSPQGDSEDEDAYLRRKADADEKGRYFEESISAQGVDYYQTLYQDVQECQHELLEFDKRVDERFQHLAPGTTGMRQALEDCLGLVRRILKDKGGLVDGDAGEGDEAVSEEAGDGQAAGTAGGGGPIRTRQDALNKLEEVAAYLRRTEPHSPMSYLIQRALSWSQMSLDQLLLELVEDESVRSRIDVTLGIRRSDGQPEQQEGSW